MPIDRRSLLHVAGVSGGGLLLSFMLDEPGALLLAATAPTTFRPNAWLRIEAGGALVFILDKSEMGQGVSTTLPTILAEELEVDPDQLTLEQAPADRVYGNPQTAGVQMTGGSSSVASSYNRLRLAGATARIMLIEAAARRWQVPIANCVARQAKVLHPTSGRSLHYAELAAEAALLPVPAEPTLKEAKDFRSIGQPRKRRDSWEKIQGQAIYGIDVQIEEMLHAVLLRSPQVGAKLKSWQPHAAMAVPGVNSIVPVADGLAIVAQRYWQARKAAALVTIQWEQAEHLPPASEEFAATFRRLGREKAVSLLTSSKLQKRLAADEATSIEADYWVPYAAHAAMEPINCTVRLSEKLCEIWAPTQSPGLAQVLAAQITGLDAEQVRIHTTQLGGGFGRRLYQDYVAQAVLIAQAVGKPIKLIWSREEDMQHDFYRPATFHAVRAAIDAKGQPLAWLHAVVGASVLAETIASWMPAILPNWVPDFMKSFAGLAAQSIMRVSSGDATATEGASDMVYGIPELKVTFQREDPGIPVGFWRSVGHSYNGFVVESCIDELAHLAHQDPLRLRLQLLAAAPRQRRVLEELARRADWQRELPPGLFRGLALHTSFGTVCGQVAEVRVDAARKKIKVERVLCVVDCGRAINPAIVEAQIAGGVVFGLSAALKGEITVKEGRIVQSNFHDYEVLRFDECPRIEVFTLPSEELPSGVGEPGVPPIAAAVANAVFKATGQRLRSLPLRLS